MIVDAVRVSCGSDGVMAEDDPLRPPFTPPDPGHNPSEANPVAEARLHPHNPSEANPTAEARLHSDPQPSLIQTQQQDQKCSEKSLSRDSKGCGGEVCQGCHDVIADRFLLRVNSRSWHQTCLRCCVCQLALDRQPSCFIREHNVYCKADYTRNFGARCAKCCRSIGAADWVRRARDRVYHLACFACDACKRQLSTGEEFALHDSRVLCKQHYLESIEGGASSNDESDGSGKVKSKRVRTTFSDEQLQVLQANFQIDSNPDGQDLERIAQITGLSKRVTQVWFQNNRARQKKYMTQGKRHHAPPPSAVGAAAGYSLERAPSRLSDYGDVSSSTSSSPLDSPLSQILYSFG
ncbi:LIM/homeobox protein Awh-like isoform X1 [Panulirus ornatus]|uniref:LIM/homeobox protein Awh-like isoform X1 n=1 Tax=Panulirus ornatus TaxID=150431 RepID=UPI003A8838FA